MSAPAAARPATIKHSKTFDCPNGCQDERITITVTGKPGEDGRRVWYSTQEQTCDCDPNTPQMDALTSETVDEARA